MIKNWIRSAVVVKPSIITCPVGMTRDKISTKDYWSEDRIKVFYNCPENRSNTLAIFSALSDLKKSVQITIYCPSHWFVKYYGYVHSVEETSQDLLDRITLLLNNHNYLFQYYKLNDKPSGKDFSSTSSIIRPLRSRCRQIANSDDGKIDYTPVDYSELLIR